MSQDMRPLDHVGHDTSLRESSDTYWHYSVEEDGSIRLFDYTIGDGEGDYVLVCYSCGTHGPLADDVEMDWI